MAIYKIPDFLEEYINTLSLAKVALLRDWLCENERTLHADLLDVVEASLLKNGYERIEAPVELAVEESDDHLSLPMPDGLGRAIKSMTFMDITKTLNWVNNVRPETVAADVEDVCVEVLHPFADPNHR